jgi:hypothetical protein
MWRHSTTLSRDVAACVSSSPQHLWPASNAVLPVGVDTSPSPPKQEYSLKPAATFSSNFGQQHPRTRPNRLFPHHRQNLPSIPHALKTSTPTPRMLRYNPSYLQPKAAKRSPSKSPNKLHSAATAEQNIAVQSLLLFDIDRASIHRSIRPGTTLPLQQKVRGAEVARCGGSNAGGIAGQHEFSGVAFDEHWRSGEGVGLLLFEEKSRGDKA